MRVLVLAKEPVAGQSKTRLQQRWSPAQAAALAQASLADTLEAVASVDAHHELVLQGAPGDWLPPGFDVRRQVNGTHDERIAAALAAHEEPCLLIGMDTPQVTTELLEIALAALLRKDASFGPAEDGGWWCLGLRTPARHSSLVLGIPTSTTTTGAAQHAALRSARLSVELMPMLRDVDLPDDALNVAALAPDGRFAQLLRLFEHAA